MSVNPLRSLRVQKTPGKVFFKFSKVRKYFFYLNSTSYKSYFNFLDFMKIYHFNLQNKYTFSSTDKKTYFYTKYTN